MCKLYTDIGRESETEIRKKEKEDDKRGATTRPIRTDGRWTVFWNRVMTAWEGIGDEDSEEGSWSAPETS